MEMDCKEFEKEVIRNLGAKGAKFIETFDVKKIDNFVTSLELEIPSNDVEMHSVAVGLVCCVLDNIEAFKIR